MARNLIKITGVYPRKICDRTGKEALEVDVCTLQGQFRAAVSFAEEKSSDDNVTKAITVVNSLSQHLIGKSPSNQNECDKMLVENEGDKGRDDAARKKALLCLSMAICRAGAMSTQKSLHEYLRELSKTEISTISLPCPQLSLLKATGLPFKTFDILATGAKNTREALEICRQIKNTLRDKLKEIIPSRSTGSTVLAKDDESSAFYYEERSEVSEVLKTLNDAVTETGHAEKVCFHIDVKADNFYNSQENKYNLKKFDPEDNGENLLDSSQLIDHLSSLIKDFPRIKSLSDPLVGGDENMAKCVKDLTPCLIGSANFTAKTFQKQCEKKELNHLFLEMSSMQTVSEIVEAIANARKKSCTVTLIDHNVTDNDFSANIGAGLSIDALKAGASSRYNQLLRIEEELAGKAKFADKFLKS